MSPARMPRLSARLPGVVPRTRSPLAAFSPPRLSMSTPSVDKRCVGIARSREIRSAGTSPNAPDCTRSSRSRRNSERSLCSATSAAFCVFALAALVAVACASTSVPLTSAAAQAARDRHRPRPSSAPRKQTPNPATPRVISALQESYPRHRSARASIHAECAQGVIAQYPQRSKLVIRRIAVIGSLQPRIDEAQIRQRPKIIRGTGDAGQLLLQLLRSRLPQGKVRDRRGLPGCHRMDQGKHQKQRSQRARQCTEADSSPAPLAPAPSLDSPPQRRIGIELRQLPEEDAGGRRSGLPRANTHASPRHSFAPPSSTPSRFSARASTDFE